MRARRCARHWLKKASHRVKPATITSIQISRCAEGYGQPPRGNCLTAVNITPHSAKSLRSLHYVPFGAATATPAAQASRPPGSPNVALCLAPRSGCRTASSSPCSTPNQRARVPPAHGFSQALRAALRTRGARSHFARSCVACSRASPSVRPNATTTSTPRLQAVQGIHPPCTALASVSSFTPSRPGPAGALRAAWTERAPAEHHPFSR